MTMNRSVKGYALAAIAAAAYGTNPIFAIPLYEQGMNPNSVLFFRYLMGLPVLAALMAARGVGFAIERRQIFPVAVLGVLMAISSLTLFESYNYMNAGVASTLLFVYPILVAVLMVAFFHEKFRSSIVICLAIMCVGLWLLMKPEGDSRVSTFGCLLVMLSAFTYAVYIIMVNVSKEVRTIPTTRLLFHVLLWGSLVFVVKMAFGTPLTIPARGADWSGLLALAIIPTVVSLTCTTVAIQLIGSTPTAIFGALEPVSAVVLSYFVLHQPITLTEIIGGLLIVIATTLVVAGHSVDRAILRVRKMFPRRNS